jgi:hypothetical protein
MTKTKGEKKMKFITIIIVAPFILSCGDPFAGKDAGFIIRWAILGKDPASGLCAFYNIDKVSLGVDGEMKEQYKWPCVQGSIQTGEKEVKSGTYEISLFALAKDGKKIKETDRVRKTITKGITDLGMYNFYDLGPVPQCINHKDDDGDELKDYSDFQGKAPLSPFYDPGCEAWGDNDESPKHGELSVSLEYEHNGTYGGCEGKENDTVEFIGWTLLDSSGQVIKELKFDKYKVTSPMRCKNSPILTWILPYGNYSLKVEGYYNNYQLNWRKECKELKVPMPSQEEYVCKVSYSK